MMNQWLSLIGIGEEGYESLSSAARLIVDNADIIVGGHRHLAMVPKGKKTFLPWKKLIGTNPKDLFIIELDGVGHGIPKDTIIKSHLSFLKKFKSILTLKLMLMRKKHKVKKIKT